MLAEHLGYANVDDMMRSMTWPQFVEWRQRYKKNPWDIKTDWQLAMLCCLFANAHRGRHSRPYKLDEFMPFFEKKPKTTEEIRQTFEVLAALMTGKKKQSAGYEAVPLRNSPGKMLWLPKE